MYYLQNYKSEGLAEVFFHKGDSVSNMCVLVTGMLGGLVYGVNKYLPYVLFLTFYLALFLTSFAFINKIECKKEKSKFKIKLKGVILLTKTYPYVFVAILSQFIMKPLFHYWQPFFHEIYTVDSTDMSFIFVSYSLAMSGISYGYSKIVTKDFFRSDWSLGIIAFISACAYLSLPYINEFFFISVFIFSVLFGVTNLNKIASSVLIQHQISREDRMVATKWVSLLARIGMSLSLLLINYFLVVSGQKVQKLFEFYGIIMLSFTIVLFILILKKGGRLSYGRYQRVE